MLSSISRLPSWCRKTNQNIDAFKFSTNACSGDKVIILPPPKFHRAAEKRKETTWLSESFSKSGLVMPLLGDKNLIKSGEPVLLPSRNFPTENISDKESHVKPVFLGLLGDKNDPVFAVDITSFYRADSQVLSGLEGAEWVDLCRYGSQLKAEDVGLMAYARGMLEWHKRNRYCGSCGGKMEWREGGHSLQCASVSCGSHVYPRLDPAIIVLVAYEDYVLLGRQSRWDEGHYSVLAGLVEIGETFETTVAREVLEESGVHLDPDSVRYVASQPWPFPSSLMIGFIASAKAGMTPPHIDADELHNLVPVGHQGRYILYQRRSLPKVEVDQKELEDARWIHRSFLERVLQGLPTPGTKFSVPGKHAIAHSLMKLWISQFKENEWAGKQIPAVDIGEGVFKYVLVRVFDGSGNEKLVVRGHTQFAYHAEIFNHFKSNLKSGHLQVQVLGGGRIEHDPHEHFIHVYGYSQAYGRANHAVTMTILQQWFPFHTVSISWTGY